MKSWTLMEPNPWQMQVLLASRGDAALAQQVPSCKPATDLAYEAYISSKVAWPHLSATDLANEAYISSKVARPR